MKPFAPVRALAPPRLASALVAAALLSVALAAASPAAAQKSKHTPTGTKITDAAAGNKADQPARVTRGIAVLSAAEGYRVEGTVTFEMTDRGMKVVADLSGLAPGKHGFHLHEFGDCSAPDYTSAGPHFMIDAETHGAPGAAGSHRGDLGNLEADVNGKAHLEWVDPHLSFTGPDSILGRSVIVHEKEDDLTSQPSGNSGARIACGVIGVAKG